MTISDDTAPIAVGVASGSTTLPFSITSETRVTIVHNLPYYEGAYVITPSQEEQVLPTHEHSMIEDIIINPIPSNYGLITWNGSILTVS